ncbi:acyl carrier protein [Stappia indica]|uniref:acyl carrier protein n=1 Tax=Stappia indica TaxID=538381 RepID=UPI001D18AF66|nr:acyl carrier protein [Stappia indica]MCC4245949.1 acyl carrier protein [Stappia indica]
MSAPDLMSVQKNLLAYLMDNSGVNVSGGIDPEENLLDSGILDSLGIAEVTEYMEKEFGIAIDEDEITSQNYKTLNALSGFCHSKITSAAA